MLQFEELMGELKESDSKMREQLVNLFEMTRKELELAIEQENIIEKQLLQEESTKDYNRKIQEFQSLLKWEECPIVVAGKFCIL